MTARRSFRPRVMPVLLMRDRMLYKSVRFKEHKYVGDPRNAVRIFNEKGVDELVLLDIAATPNGSEPDYQTIQEIAGEAFMPVAYGGGIRTAEQARRILDIGIEKVVLCSAAVETPQLIEAIARASGIQSVVVCIDVKRDLFGRETLMTQGGRKKAGISPLDFARQATAAGAGELMVQSIDRDGTMQGYDCRLTARIAEAVDVPVIALGGAGNENHLRTAIDEGKASAAAAGSMFVFQGPHRAVLITYPDDLRLRDLFAGAPARMP